MIEKTVLFLFFKKAEQKFAKALKRFSKCDINRRNKRCFNYL